MPRILCRNNYSRNMRRMKKCYYFPSTPPSTDSSSYSNKYSSCRTSSTTSRESKTIDSIASIPLSHLIDMDKTEKISEDGCHTSMPSLSISECSSVDSFPASSVNFRSDLAAETSRNTTLPSNCLFSLSEGAYGKPSLCQKSEFILREKKISRDNFFSVEDEDWGYFVDVSNEMEELHLCQQKGRFLVSRKLI
uniref:Uncharacterized protein n=1 Tax=Corethron hystrix TaxID=216773 RepID=A0A7S1B4A3_9STRA|mmetsp:Transcript_11951/g.26209  ORF Transcript_11951/g.26209 Transcript_11951/m.26209 type:complete len:193 (+) Transcript_11951:320-898(+)